MNPKLQMNWLKWLLAPQRDRVIDYAPRGNGNRAARRAAETQAAVEHLRWIDEPIYTDRRLGPWIERGMALRRGLDGKRGAR